MGNKGRKRGCFSTATILEGPLHERARLNETLTRAVSNDVIPADGRRAEGIVEEEKGEN